MKNFGTKLYRYDVVHYDQDEYCIDKKELYSSKYQLVTLTSVIEHLRSYDEINDIFSLVADNGCLALHTFISQDHIQNDPNWFYLLPVHCAFHTNKSMKILSRNFGFNFCAYNYDARMWFLFKNISKFESEEIITKSKLFDGTSWDGWVDYTN